MAPRSCSRGGEPAEQGALLHQQPVAQQPGQIQIGQVEPWIGAPVDGFQPAGPEVVLLQLADGGPEKAVVLEGEVIEFAAPQLGADAATGGGAAPISPSGHASAAP